MQKEDLMGHVRLAINPQFTNWVLFKNGTYIIFDDVDAIADVAIEAEALMRTFGPVVTGGPAGDFEVIHLDNTAGWVVAGHGYGMYTYVHPSELENNQPSDLEIGLYGRSKRDEDGQMPGIIHINAV